MKRFDLVYMDMATDGTTSSGMGASTGVTDSGANTQTQTTTNGLMSEDDALNFLNSNGAGNGEQQPNNNPQGQQNTQQGQNQGDDLNINLDDIDLNMFGVDTQNTTVNPQDQPNVQDIQMQVLLTQLLEKFNNNQQVQQPQQDPIEIQALSQLAKQMQEAGLMPKGISDEDKQLLQEAKTMFDEIKQQKAIEEQQREYTAKINNIDSFSKELEQTIPGYNNNFMIQLVSKISQQNPNAGQQILNNPAMLIPLWNKYGAKAQPKQQQSNVISGGNGGNGATANELLEKVRNGQATEQEELNLINSL